MKSFHVKNSNNINLPPELSQNTNIVSLQSSEAIRSKKQSQTQVTSMNTQPNVKSSRIIPIKTAENQIPLIKKAEK